MAAAGLAESGGARTELDGGMSFLGCKVAGSVSGEGPKAGEGGKGVEQNPQFLLGTPCLSTRSYIRWRT
ncbi:unnamed protein product [Linum trigynum]|uniref:Uncharacterized protein n=1 Tax=Linum trigynum TaxID=586398 RepID=A0AAV2EZU6_9ROSI